MKERRGNIEWFTVRQNGTASTPTTPTAFRLGQSVGVLFLANHDGIKRESDQPNPAEQHTSRAHSFQ